MKVVVPGFLRRSRRRVAAMTGSRTRPAGPAAYLAAVSALAATLAAARMFTSGAGWHWDSVRYLAAARSLLAGSGFLDADSAPGYHLWPPLYPLLLAAGGLFADPVVVPGPLNAAAFALTIFCFGRYLWARLDSLFLRVWAPLACALSLPLAENARWAMTETIFILLVTLALMGVDEYRANGSSKALVFAAVFSALAWQTRHAGAALVVTAGLLILLDRRRPFRERVRHSAIFGAITGAPMALWLWRTYRLLGTPITTVRPETALDWREIFEGTVSRLASWTDFDTGPTTLAVVSSLALAAVLARKRLETTGRPTSGRAVAGPNWLAAWGLFWLLYLVLVVVALRTGSTWHGVQVRHLTPLYVPTVAVVAGLCDRFFARARTRPTAAAARAAGGPFARAGGRLRRLSGPASRIAVTTLLSWWLVGQAGPAADAIARENSSDSAGTGYGSARWADSETLDALRPPAAALHPDARLYSNIRSAVSLYTGAHGMFWIPPSRELAVETVLTGWLDGVPDGSRVVWFRRWEQNRERFAPTPLALRVSPSLVPVGEFTDGTIFEVDRTSSPAMPSPPTIHFDSVVADSPDALRAGDVFDLYIEGGNLWYSREPCVPGDVEERFRLAVTVPSLADPDGLRRKNLDFDFADYGVLSNGRCLAVVPLRADGYSKFETGQRHGTTPWRASGLLDPERHREALRSLAAGEWGEPDARAAFEVYLDGNEIRYFREPCAAREVEAGFFLHFYGPPTESAPGSSADAARRRVFENRDFAFSDYGVILGDRCLAMVPATDPDAFRISTGQFAAGEPPTWSVDLWPGKRLLESRLASISSGGLGEPNARSAFDLYFREDEILYYRAPCSPADLEGRFALSFHPTAGLAPGGEPLNRDFDFYAHGVIEDGRCLARVPLPEGRYGRLETGQWAGAGPWRVTRRLDLDRYRAALASWTDGEWGEPEVRAAFDLYDREGEVRYVRKPCAAEDTEARFYLHFHRVGDSTGENRDFDFAEYGVMLDDACLAIAPQPEGDFRRIATGQFIGGSPPNWRAELRPEERRRESLLESIAAGRRGPPAARSTFDLYLIDSALVFHRAPCSAGDAEARFFLHLYAEDAADLPAERRNDGFENRDFDFDDYGDSFAEACIARVPLPDYPISRIRTGQFHPGGETRWSAEPSLRPAVPSR